MVDRCGNSQVNARFRLNREDSLLLIVDIQERLAAAMEERSTVITNTGHLIALSQLLAMPIIVTEQYPKGLGHTVPELASSLLDAHPIEKRCFSCYPAEGFKEAINTANRESILLVGMEAHVCVLQTCLDLLDEGLKVHVVEDAVCSRRTGDKRTAMEMMRDAGAVITSTETALFQLLGGADDAAFKTISQRIK